MFTTSNQLAIVALSVSLVALNTGCATSSGSLSGAHTFEWAGRNYLDLLATNGIPNSIYEDGKGGRVLIYSNTVSPPPVATLEINKSRRLIDETYIWSQNKSGTPPPRSLYDTEVLYVDSQGIIYAAQNNRSQKAVREALENEAIGLGFIGVVVYLILVLSAS